MKSVAGIDVSKATLDVRFQGKSLSFANDAAGHKKLARWIKGAELVVMEATGAYHFAAACALHKANLPVAVVNPARPCYYAKSLGKRNKTDKVDAKTLVEFGCTHELDLFVPPTQEEQALCQYVRLRSDLVDQRAQVKNRLKEPMVSGFEMNMLKAQAEFFDGQISSVEKEIQKLVKSSSVLTRSVELLTGIPGIGQVSAWTLLAELKDVKRFASAKKVAAFAGLCPAVRQSGTSLTGPGTLSRQGNRTVRKCLYMSALAAIRQEGAFREFFLRLVTKGKNKKSALVAVMHKLIRTAFGVLKKDCPFNPEWALKTK